MLQIQEIELTQLFDTDNTNSVRRTSCRQNGCKGLHQHQPNTEDHHCISFRHLHNDGLKMVLVKETKIKITNDLDKLW